jgi:hypothetical protein
MTQRSEYPGNRACCPLVRLRLYRKGKPPSTECGRVLADSDVSDGGFMVL